MACSPVLVVGAESLGSGRRVRGREAIACDAKGALDAAAVTETLIGRGRRLPLGHLGWMTDGPYQIRCC